MYRALVTDNIILRGRCRGHRRADPGDGPALRRYAAGAAGSGVAYDVRRAEPYSVYDRLDFDIPTGQKGDVMDRYEVRMAELASGCASSNRRWTPCRGRAPQPRPAERFIPPKGGIYFAGGGRAGQDRRVPAE